MDRLVAILLMPFFVVGNSFAHSHGSAAHPSHSHGRTHFHVGSTIQHGHEHESHGHVHHSHSHSHSDDQKQNHARDDSQPAPVEKPVGHDSDAVYVFAADFFAPVSDRSSMEVGQCAAFEKVVDFLPAVRPPATRALKLRSTAPELPLYLLHAALRL